MYFQNRDGKVIYFICLKHINLDIIFQKTFALRFKFSISFSREYKMEH